MIALCQRVSEASVSVDDTCISKIGLGWLILLGIFSDDSEEDVNFLVDKICKLRGFSDDFGKFNLSLTEVGGAVLVVSQFTLCADMRKGNRPSFSPAAKPEQALSLYHSFVAKFKEYGIRTEIGQFGASMSVTLCNSGPVTFSLDSRQGRKTASPPV